MISPGVSAEPVAGQDGPGSLDGGIGWAQRPWFFSLLPALPTALAGKHQFSACTRDERPPGQHNGGTAIAPSRRSLSACCPDHLAQRRHRGTREAMATAPCHLLDKPSPSFQPPILPYMGIPSVGAGLSHPWLGQSLKTERPWFYGLTHCQLFGTQTPKSVPITIVVFTTGQRAIQAGVRDFAAVILEESLAPWRPLPVDKRDGVWVRYAQRSCLRGSRLRVCVFPKPPEEGRNCDRRFFYCQGLRARLLTAMKFAPSCC